MKCVVLLIILLPFISCTDKSGRWIEPYIATDTLKSDVLLNESDHAPPVAIEITSKNPPKITRSKPPYAIKDTNKLGSPFFSNYNTQQGLALNTVLCITTDKSGNLWIGTAGGGASRFNGTRFSNYNLSQGLSSNMIFSIVEDENGNIWFATSEGVSKYDGYRFTNFTTAQGLAGNFVSCILKDDKGDLWFGTHEGGVSRYDGKKFINYSTKQGLPDNYIRCMAKDKEGNIWFGTATGGVCKYDGNGFNNYSTKNGIIGNLINDMLQDNQGNIWICTKEGITRMKDNTCMNYTKAQGLPDNNVNCIAIDDDGALWFGTQSGSVVKFEGNQFINYGKLNDINETTISGICKDHTGGLWFSTEGSGIFRYQGSHITSYRPFPGRSGNSVFSIIRNNKGNLWFGSAQGGASEYDGKRFLIYTSGTGLPDDFIWNIYQDKQGNIWFCTDKGGACKYDGQTYTTYTTTQGLLSNTVTGIIQDQGGDIWFGTFKGVSRFNGKQFFNYTTKQGLTGNKVLSIINDNEGNIWFTTHDHGISKFDGKKFTNYSTAQGLAGNTTYISIKDSRGNLWFGTNRGVSKFDGHQFTNYTTAQGFPDNCIWGLAEDTQRKILWFGTNKGLVAMKESLGDTSTEKIIGIFNESTNYPISEVNAGALFVDPNGTVWIGSGHQDIIRFNYPTQYNKVSKPPELVIQNVKVNNEEVLWNLIKSNQNMDNENDRRSLLNEMITKFNKELPSDAIEQMENKFGSIQFDSLSRFYPVPLHLSLPYRFNTLSIDYSVIDPGNTVRSQYMYKLEGYHTKWISSGNQTTATLFNLPAGKYVFKLRSVTPTGNYTEIAYPFIILEPWWNSWWAYLLYLLSTSVFIYSISRYYRYRTEKKQAIHLQVMVDAQEEERKRISEELHDDVGVKLTALKLTLSSIAGKIADHYNEEVKSLTQQSEGLVSEAMHDIRSLLNNLSPAQLEEFGYVAAVESLINKLNETGKVHFDLSTYKMNIHIRKDYELALYRITQELINNVIKHAKANKASLQIIYRDKKIILMMEDDGTGFDTSKPTKGLGLHNLKIRTQLMNGKITFDSHKNSGTSIIIEIPYTEH